MGRVVTLRLLRACGLIGALLLAVGGCSTAPRVPDQVTDVRNQAAQNAEFGNRYFRQGNYDLALQFFEQALRLNNSIDNRDGAAGAHNSIGRVYLAVGQIDHATDAFAVAYAIADETRNARILLQSATNLAEAAARTGDLDRALAYLDTADTHRTTDTAPADHAILLHNRASVAARRGDFGGAERYLGDAMSLNASARLHSELAANHFLLASILTRQGEYERALTEAERALELDKQMENSVGIAADLRALGLISRRLGRISAAVNYLERSLYVTVSIGLVAPSIELLELLEELETERAQPERAARYRQQRDLLDAAR